MYNQNIDTIFNLIKKISPSQYGSLELRGLKLQEEVGELSAEILKTSGFKSSDLSKEEIREKLLLGDFGKVPEYAESFAVKHSNILISLSQISETLFILAIPFFLRRFGIKQVMFISMVAWVLRFGLFGVGTLGAVIAVISFGEYF